MNSIGWDLKLEKVCDKCPELESEFNVILSEKADAQIKTLIKNFQETEWIAGMKGQKKMYNVGEVKEAYYIEELVLTEQEVTGGHAEFTDKGNIELSKIKLIGWIHSHNNMTAFFSGTDQTTAMMYDVSIVVNNEHKAECVVKKRLSCGRMSLAKAKLTTISAQQDEPFLKQAKEVIKETTIKWSSNYGGFSSHKYGNYDDDEFNRLCMVCNNTVSLNPEKRTECFWCKKKAHISCLPEGKECPLCAEEEGIVYG